MRRAIPLLLILIWAVAANAQATQEAKPEKKKAVHMGIGRTLTYPVRHPIKFQKGVAAAAKKTAQVIW